jgi:hypothetical protein
VKEDREEQLYRADFCTNPSVQYSKRTVKRKTASFPYKSHGRLTNVEIIHRMQHNILFIYEFCFSARTLSGMRVRKRLYGYCDIDQLGGRGTDSLL